MGDSTVCRDREITILAAILYWCSLRATRCEVISIYADNIQIEVGRKKTRQLYGFQRAWTQVELYPPVTPNERSRLVMRSKGKELEIGECLSGRERQALQHQLKKLFCDWFST